MSEAIGYRQEVPGGRYGASYSVKRREVGAIYVNARALIERRIGNERYIVVQTRNKPGEKRQLELPGGQVERFESLVSALCREVREETGLTVTSISGQDIRTVTKGSDSRVECFTPFAVYQTLEGPVPSMGVYFRCSAHGEFLTAGDASHHPRWVSMRDVQAWLRHDPERFSWVDRAGLQYYITRTMS